MPGTRSFRRATALRSKEAAAPSLSGGGSVRIILTVMDPDATFARALAAGASEIFAWEKGHGWRLGAWWIRSGCIGRLAGRWSFTCSPANKIKQHLPP